MKIGILGTRGIPNNYGGFEQLAEHLSVALVQRGHELHVYCSSLHPYQQQEHQGVKLIHCSDPEDRLGTFGQFIYDFNCIRDSRRRNFDIILQLGYTSSSVWSFLLPSNSILITNMDGMEWKRSKYSKPVQYFLKQAEKWAVKSSDKLVADSTAIQSYLKSRYGKDSAYIAYGADPFENPDESVLAKFDLEKKKYFLAIARFEPENNLEMMIRGYLETGSTEPLVLIGSQNQAFGRYLSATYKDPRIRFAGSLYDINALNNLRFFSKMYFHGHSAGGTNPSLLEAMASQALIAAHNNEFNRAVLNEDAFYFSNVKEVTGLIQSLNSGAQYQTMIANNLSKIKNSFRWGQIVDAYEQLMIRSLS